MIDCIGNTIKPGDFLVRAIREGNSGAIVFGVVINALDKLQVVPITNWRGKYTAARRKSTLAGPETSIVVPIHLIKKIELSHVVKIVIDTIYLYK